MDTSTIVPQTIKCHSCFELQGEEIIPRYYQICWKMCPQISGNICGFSMMEYQCIMSERCNILWNSPFHQWFRWGYLITLATFHVSIPFCWNSKIISSMQLPLNWIGTHHQTFSHCWCAICLVYFTAFANLSFTAVLCALPLEIADLSSYCNYFLIKHGFVTFMLFLCFLLSSWFHHHATWSAFLFHSWPHILWGKIYVLVCTTTTF